MERPTSTTLVRLRDSGRTVADPQQDVRRRRLVDAQGEDLGRIDDLLVDPDEGQVRMLRVEHGGILGIGSEVFFVPVEALVEVTDEAVHADLDRESVAGAPVYDPDLTDEGDFYASVYGYYGYTPYGGAGYVAPPWPNGPVP